MNRMNKPFTPLKVSAPVRTCPEPSTEETRRDKNTSGLGLFRSKTTNSNSPSPNPVTATVQREVWHHLTAGLGMLSPNDHGRPWPLPRRDRLRELLAEFDGDLCVAAAKEAREIVQSQDRAPNITSLFEKKLRERAAKREAVRESLGVSA